MQWLERETLPMSLPAVRAVSNPACYRIIREVSCSSPLNLVTYFDVVSLCKALHAPMLHFTFPLVKMTTW